jgi:hypothetical protein
MELRRNLVVYDDSPANRNGGFIAYGRINSIRGDYAEVYLSGGDYEIIQLQHIKVVDYKGDWRCNYRKNPDDRVEYWHPMPTLRKLKAQYHKRGYEQKSFRDFHKKIFIKDRYYCVYRIGDNFEIEDILMVHFEHFGLGNIVRDKPHIDHNDNMVESVLGNIAFSRDEFAIFELMM